MNIYIHWYFLPIILFLIGMYYLFIKQTQGDYDFMPPILAIFFIILSIGIVVGHYI